MRDGFLISIFLIGWLLLPFFSTLVLAAVVTGLFNPVYQYVVDKFKMAPSLAAFVTCILIFFILFIVVMVFGADKIPEIARGLGKGMRYLRNATNEIKQEIQEAEERSRAEAQST